MKRVFLALSLSVLFLAAACDSGGGGTLVPDSGIAPSDTTSPRTDNGSDPQTDTGSNPQTDWGSGPRPDLPAVTGSGIAALQQEEVGLTCDPSMQFMDHEGTRTFENLTVVSPRFTPTDTIHGYYVAEGAGAWKGVQLTVDASMGTDLQPGDVITITGEGKEFYCFTQVKVLQPPTLVSQGGPVPASTDVLGATVAPTSVDAEPYEGVLVRLTDVTVDTVESWGFTLQGSGVMVNDSTFRTGVRVKPGCHILSLEGVVTYSFSEYKLLPLTRDAVQLDPASDCAVETVGSISAVQQATESTTCDPANEFVNPASGAGLSIADVVVTSPLVYVSSSLRGYFVAEAAGGPWSGILATFGKDDDPQLVVGDVVTVTGDWLEYRCLTELKGATLTKTGTGTVPAPAALDVAQLVADPAYGEQFEGVLVTVGAQTVATPPSDANHWQATMESGLQLGGSAFYHYGDMPMAAGTAFASVTGVLTWNSYDPAHYELLPRSASDLPAAAQ